MHISQVRIKNYRSCKSTHFELHPHLSVLIGPNGSGKTNVLSALMIFQKLATEERNYNHQEELITGDFQVKAWFEDEEKKVIFTSDVASYTDDENMDEIVASMQRWYLKDYSGDSARPEFPLNLAKYYVNRHNSSGKVPISIRYNLRHYAKNLKHLPEEGPRVITDIAAYVAGMKYYGASQFTNPGKCPVSFDIEKTDVHKKASVRRKRLRFSEQGHEKFLFDLYSQYKRRDGANKSQGFDKFMEIVGPRGVGLIDKIDFEEIETSSITYSVRSGGKVEKRDRKSIIVIPKITIGEHKLSPNQLSEGTFKTITLLFYIITESSSLLLIEEPEVCVHHGLLSSIIELIKTYSMKKQIIISTHSDYVLDQVSPENVYKVDNQPSDGTKVVGMKKGMSASEYEALREYLDAVGNLGEYWKEGGLE